jgi:hypothetical protein
LPRPSPAARSLRVGSLAPPRYLNDLEREQMPYMRAWEREQMRRLIAEVRRLRGIVEAQGKALRNGG